MPATKIAAAGRGTPGVRRRADAVRDRARSPPAQPLSGPELLAAPRALAAAVAPARPLELPAGRPPTGCARSGCTTVGDLLEHLPRDSREARTIADAARRRAGDGRGRGALDRRRGRCAAGGCARSSRRPSPTRPAAMRATFFNQPWLVERYPPGTRLLLHGKADGRGRLPRLPPRASAAELGAGAHGSAPAGRRAGGRRSPTTRRPRASPRPRSSRSCRATPSALGGRHRAAAGGDARAPSGCPTARARCAAMHFPRGARDAERGPARGSPSRSCC